MGGEPRWSEVEVRRGRGGWCVVIPAGEDGGTLEYAYRTRKKACYFAAIFRLAPTWYPAPQRVCVVRHKVPAASASPSVAA